MQGKVAIEEHFVPRGLESLITNPGWPADAWQATLDALTDVDRRLEQMDEFGIEMSVLSLGTNGIQDVLEVDRAIALARETDDKLAELVARHPDRFSGFAALPMQDPAAAAEELDRAVRDLHLKGALVNGYTSLGDLSHGVYYDGDAYLEFWQHAEALEAPLYLHPRNPLPTQRVIYAGREELLGPTWAFAVETATHALRLITSGLFDRCPRLQVILGHLGEFLPFAIRRLEQRLSRRVDVTLARPASRYLAENFYITTSGNYHTPSLIGAILELGAERIIFSADYPFEDMRDGASWFDNAPISDADRRKIGRDNVCRLLGLTERLGAPPRA